eukprot:gnl/TRDRNA2_/TRDRNA2_163527_c0_seq5.p2 gnl/TRDRNA2_/TRDRNA2_163527_c0~~gnl/TRDRNA2_/TRDRNA2_163527_c0_seq5.p2  ORF type:complete len:106 (+),score=9.86 gnl/TRDRNA2_/TRDRNA2_163527_c0_seq5:54-371(+)
MSIICRQSGQGGHVSYAFGRGSKAGGGLPQGRARLALPPPCPALETGAALRVGLRCGGGHGTVALCSSNGAATPGIAALFAAAAAPTAQLLAGAADGSSGEQIRT